MAAWASNGKGGKVMGQMASPERRSSNTYESGALASWHHAQVDGVVVTDESLIQRIRSKDETALAVLYARHAGMVYSVVRPILTEEGAAKEIIPHVFYRIWLKASDFKSANGSVPEFLTVTARNCAFDQFLRRGFENGGLLLANRSAPAFNVELMARVSKIVADLPGPECGPAEIGKFEDAKWARSDRHMEQLINALRGKIRTALKALRELPLGTPNSNEQSKQVKS